MPSQEEINNQLELLMVYRQTLTHLLKQQAAQGGPAFATVTVLNGIQECRNQIHRIKLIFSEWDIIFEHHPDDSSDYFASNQTSIITDTNDHTILPDDSCPYLGLQAFHEEHTHLFFGRERIVDELINKLKFNRLLVIVGPSGRGKTSLLRAGLIPKLKAGILQGSQFWNYPLPIVPGSTPITKLLETNVRDVLLGEKLNAIPNPICLAIDSFEDIFTICSDEKQRAIFVKTILYLIQEKYNHRVIMTMRNDMTMFVARIPELQSIFERSIFYITPMMAGELRDSIVLPAQQAGLKFEPNVIESLLNDIIGEPAALPLLQFTLLKLWEYREYNRVTFRSYTQIGGGRQALTRSAEQFYENLLPEQQIMVKRVLLSLVFANNSYEIISRSVRLQDLYESGDAPERIDDILMKLINARLVKSTLGDIPENNEYAIVHEALIRNWPRLVNWIDDMRRK